MLARDLGAAIRGGRGETREAKQSSDSPLPCGPTRDGMTQMLGESVEALIFHVEYLL